jgi:hypothetical protein
MLRSEGTTAGSLREGRIVRPRTYEPTETLPIVGHDAGMYAGLR